MKPAGRRWRRERSARPVDPLDQKASQRAALAVSSVKPRTFDQCAAAYHAAHEPGWTPHYAQLWQRSVAQHASPVFGHLPVQAVDRDLVLRVLEPIWTELPVGGAAGAIADRANPGLGSGT